MKKLLTIVLALAMVFSLAACGESGASAAKSEAKTETKSEAKTEAKSEAKTETKSEAKTEAKSEAPAASGTEGKKIGFVALGSTEQPFLQAQAGAKSVCDKYGWELIIKEPEIAFDQAAQIEKVEELLVMGIDGLVIQPVDKLGANDVIQKACDAGVAVVTMDTGVACEDVIANVANNHENDGYKGACWLFDQMGGKGNVVEIILTFNNEAGTKRHEGFQRALAEYPDINVVAEVNAQENAENAVSGMEDAMNANDDIGGAFIAWGGGGLAVYNAIQAAGRGDEIITLCVDAYDEGLQLAYEGKDIGIVGKDATDLGAMPCELLYKYWNGEEVEKNVDPGSTVVDATNVEQFVADHPAFEGALKK